MHPSSEQTIFHSGEKNVLFHTNKNTVNTTAGKQLLLCSQKCPEHRVCVTDPHSSVSAGALLKEQRLNRECCLAGVSFPYCVVCIRICCFSNVWLHQVEVQIFPPVRKTVLASFWIVLIPFLCSQCLSVGNRRKDSNSLHLTTLVKLLLLPAIISHTSMFWCRILGIKSPSRLYGRFFAVSQELAEHLGVCTQDSDSVSSGMPTLKKSSWWF